MADKTYVLLDDVIAYIASCERSDMLPVECSAITLIKNIPAADVVEVKHGQWINERWEGLSSFSSECSLCGKRTLAYFRYCYCPNCGAKMNGGQNKNGK